MYMPNGLGYKQQALLELIKKKGTITISFAKQQIGFPSDSHALSAIRALELKGFIKFKGEGIWVYQKT